jgi:uncharacterized damage-inducible protein DinB
MRSQLAEFARAVRQSTLTRLRLVPAGFENWRIDDEAMSFADTAQHLVDSDAWLRETLRTGVSQHMVGRARCVEVGCRRDYEALLGQLAESGERLGTILDGLDQADLETTVLQSDGSTEATAWWTIVRGALDHEIHHRGQVVAYLRALGHAAG